MKNNIQTIIDKLSDEFNLSEVGEKLLKDSLTLMLDGIEKSLGEEEIETSAFGVGYNMCREEVINIINSHR